MLAETPKQDPSGSAHAALRFAKSRRIVGRRRDACSGRGSSVPAEDCTATASPGVSDRVASLHSGDWSSSAAVSQTTGGRACCIGTRSRGRATRAARRVSQPASDSRASDRLREWGVVAAPHQDACRRSGSGQPLESQRRSGCFVVRPVADDGQFDFGAASRIAQHLHTGRRPCRSARQEHRVRGNSYEFRTKFKPPGAGPHHDSCLETVRSRAAIDKRIHACSRWPGR